MGSKKQTKHKGQRNISQGLRTIKRTTPADDTRAFAQTLANLLIRIEEIRRSVREVGEARTAERYGEAVRRALHGFLKVEDTTASARAGFVGRAHDLARALDGQLRPSMGLDLLAPDGATRGLIDYLRDVFRVDVQAAAAEAAIDACRSKHDGSKWNALSDIWLRACGERVSVDTMRVEYSKRLSLAKKAWASGQDGP